MYVCLCFLSVCEMLKGAPEYRRQCQDFHYLLSTISSYETGEVAFTWRGDSDFVVDLYQIFPSEKQHRCSGNKFKNEINDENK